MDVTKQNQHAGDNSTQQQAGVINNSYTVIQFDEAKCREICNVFFQQLQQNLFVAQEVAAKREKDFEDYFIGRLQKVENGMSAFSDPAFLKTLVKVQQTAVCTDEKTDYELLSELLVKRFEIGDEKQQMLYVNKAIALVDEIPNDALFGLTMFVEINVLHVTSRCLYSAREALADVFRTIIGNNILPQGRDWIFDLASLSVVRIHDVSQFIPVSDWLPKQYDHFILAGIKKDSEQYNHACAIAKEYGYKDSIFVENELLSGYVRLHSNFYVKGGVWGSIKNDSMTTSINEESKEMAERIKGLYSRDSVLLDTVKKNFIQYLKEDAILKEVFDWWDNISIAFDLYPVGTLLGNVNARRICPDVPLIESNMIKLI